MNKHLTLLFVLLFACCVPASAAEPPRLEQNAVKLHSGDGALRLSLDAPRLIFESGDVGGTAPASIQGSLESGEPVVASYAPIVLTGGGELDIKVFLQWSAAEAVLRKWSTVRVSGVDSPLLLKEIVLERLDLNGRKPDLIGNPPQSYPAFLPGIFAGIEFPVAATRMENGRLILAHRPGRHLVPGQWFESRKAVFGIAPDNDEQEAYKNYIAAHRPEPRGLHINYNSWWTSPVPFSEKEILGLMGIFEKNLFTASGETLDTFSLDLGWSRRKGLWEINTDLFPEKFSLIQAGARKMNTNLGLWISPSNVYAPQSFDNGWAKEHGFETGPGAQWCCLGGPKYAAAFRERLVNMLTHYGIRHVKLDGYCLQCDAKDHGHEPGDFSSEAITAGGIAACEAMRKAQPDAWLEATCFGSNPSPWWLFYVNSVLGTYGDDAPNGRSPAPVWRESATSGRDYFNLQGATWLPIPNSAQEVLGLIHQTDEPFLNDGVTVILRGHFFVPMYVNPKYMNTLRWKQLAGLIKWARRNEKALARTDPLLPSAWRDGKAPKFDQNQPKMPREPYGYLHPNGKGGLVYLRNPWVEKQTVHLDVAKDLKVATGTASLSAVSLYPDVRLYGAGLHAQSALEVPLAPYETVVLSIAPDQKTAGVKPVSEVIGHHLKTGAMKTALKRILWDGPTMGPDWTAAQMANTTESLELSLEGQIETSDCAAELLVLFEGVPKTKSPAIGLAKLRVNGKDVPMTITPSDRQWKATGQADIEVWTFAASKLEAGKNAVRLEIMADANAQKVSCWVWAFKQTDAPTLNHPNALPMPECLYLDSALLLKETALNAIQEADRRSRPVERIDGIYLDSLKPVSAVQGWGKLQLNQSVWEKPLTIGGKSFQRGLGTHAPAKLVYDIPAGFKRFAATVGADAATQPTVDFEVLADGKSLWKSGLMDRNTGARTVDVNITGAKQLELRVGDGSNGISGDHADWADARLLK